jgi:hypothetical protein
MRLHWVEISAVLAGLALGLGAWGCQEESWSPPDRSGPDYTNFAPPPIEMPAPGTPQQPGDAGGPPDNPQAADLVKAATLFRTIAAADVRDALETFEARPQFEFLTADASYQESPGAWAFFFATTITVVGNCGAAEPTVAYYNPFLDAAVLTRWKTRADGEPRIAGASLRLGSELIRGGPARQAALAPWMTADESAPRALQRQYRAFMNAFSARFPPLGQTPWAAYAATSKTAMEVTGDMALLQAASLDAMQNSAESPVRPLLREFHIALAAADSARLSRILPRDNPMSAEALVGLPTLFRAHLCPVHMLTDGKRAMVFVGDSRALRFYGLVQYETEPTVRIKSVAVFDLAAEEPLVAAAGVVGGPRQ